MITLQRGRRPDPEPVRLLGGLLRLDGIQFENLEVSLSDPKDG